MDNEIWQRQTYKTGSDVMPKWRRKVHKEQRGKILVLKFVFITRNTTRNFTTQSFPQKNMVSLGALMQDIYKIKPRNEYD